MGNHILNKSSYHSSQIALTLISFLLALGLTETMHAQNCVTVPDGIVSWWTGESNTLDSVATNNGILSGGASYGPGIVGHAFKFNGANQYVRVPDSPSLRFTTALTLEAWVCPTSTPSGADYSVMVKYDAQLGLNQSAFSFSIRTDSHPYILINTDGMSSSFQITANATVPTNAWTHIAATYDGSTLSLYVNGQLDTSASFSGSIYPGTDDLGIGANIGGSVAAPFNGYIDEPAVYNVALTADQIAAIYNAGSSGKCPIPITISLQPLDETVQAGSPASFNVGVSGGSPPFSYQWQFDGTNISGATQSALNLFDVQLSQAGEYSVIVSNAAGPVPSGNALLTVNPGPPCVSAPSGLVSWWSAEGNAWDNVGGNNGNLINGGTNFVPGEVGDAFSLNGNQCVRVPDAPNLHVTNAMTLEAWVCPTSTPTSADYSVMVKYDGVPGPNQSAFSFSINTSSHLYILLNTNGTSGAIQLTANGTVPVNVWTHVATTYDGSLLSLYINGALDSSVATNGTIFPGTDDLGIGANVGGEPANGMAAPFVGYIDEPAIYNRALTATDIQNIYNASSGGKCLTTSAPAFYVQPTNVSLYTGNTAKLAAFAKGSPNLKYQWTFNGANLTGATNRTLSLTGLQPTNSGVYALSVSNALGSTVSSNAVVNVQFVNVYGNGSLLTNAQYSYSVSVQIQLKNFYTNGYVFYTLDGSTPTPDSFLYTGPFVLSNNAVIRTLGYTPDFQISGVSGPVQIQIVPSYTLSATTAGGGTITLSPNSASYISNAVVTVTATPSNGWMFLGWQGDLTGTNFANSVVMNRSKSVQAIFGTTVSTSTSSGGSVVLDPPGRIFPFGTVLQVSAIPQSGDQFLYWGDGTSGSTNPLFYTVTATNPVISALFYYLENGQLALSIVPVGHGTVSINPHLNSYNTGQSVTLTAMPNSNATFGGWSGNATGTNNPLSVVMNQSKTIYANFSTNFNLTLHQAAGSGAGNNQGLEVDLVGELGLYYRLDASSNLVNWTPLYTQTNWSGTLRYIDTNAPFMNRRFYRAAILH